MVKDVKIVGKTIREYNGLVFTYLPNIKSSMKARVSANINGQYNSLKFRSIKDAVQYINDAIADGAIIENNRLIIGKKA